MLMAIYSLSISTSRPPVASTLQSLVASGSALWEGGMAAIESIVNVVQVQNHIYIIPRKQTIDMLLL